MENIKANRLVQLQHQNKPCFILNLVDNMIRKYETDLKIYKELKDLSFEIVCVEDEMSKERQLVRYPGYNKLSNIVFKYYELVRAMEVKIFKELVKFDKEEIDNTNQIVEFVDIFYEKSIIYKKLDTGEIEYESIINSIIENITEMSKNTIKGIYRLLLEKNIPKINSVLSSYISDLNLTEECKDRIAFEEMRFERFDDDKQSNTLLQLQNQNQPCFISNIVDNMISKYETYRQVSEELNECAREIVRSRIGIVNGINLGVYPGYSKLALKSLEYFHLVKDIELTIFKELVKFDKQGIDNTNQIVEFVDIFYEKSIIYDKIQYYGTVDFIMKNLTEMSENTVNGIYKLLFEKNISKINSLLPNYISDLNLTEEYKDHIDFKKIYDEMKNEQKKRTLEKI